MKIDPKHNGAAIGGLFALGNLLLTISFVVPIFTVMPGAIVESMVSTFVDTEPYSNVGRATTLVLLIVFLLSLIPIINVARKKFLQNGDIIVIMLAEYFIIHILGFYLEWGLVHNYRSDGQLIFGAISSFPKSSFGFLALGLLIDSIKIKTSPIYEEKHLRITLGKDNQFIISTKEKFNSFEELPNDLLEKMMALVQQCVKLIKESENVRGYSVLQNGDLTNEREYFGIHIIPRYNDESFKWTYSKTTPPEAKNFDEIKSILEKNLSKKMEE